jgi:tRNA 2-thiouridine synthesizing protein A
MGCTGSLFLAEAEIVDARGLKCPLPVLKLEKRLDQVPAETHLTVLATDPIAKVDIPLFCLQQGHQCATRTEGDLLRFSIVKKG